MSYQYHAMPRMAKMLPTRFFWSSFAIFQHGFERENKSPTMSHGLRFIIVSLVQKNLNLCTYLLTLLIHIICIHYSFIHIPTSLPGNIQNEVSNKDIKEMQKKSMQVWNMLVMQYSVFESGFFFVWRKE